jgi:adenine/guanine phosphoribosyltransferase-like PRPP-binding protein
MIIIDLDVHKHSSKSAKTSKYLSQLATMLDDLRNRDLSESLVEAINKEVNAINTTEKTDYAFYKLVVAKYQLLIKLIEKEVKLVPISYYRNLWMVVGMSAFGLPFGLALSLALGGFSFLGIGIPIGMAIGIGVGKGMDNKAKDEGRQFDFEIMY